MAEMEYKTVAAPRRVRKVKGVKGRDELLAYAIGEIIQQQAVEGWRYLRADRFQVEEKSGFFSTRQTVERSVLVFGRELRRSGLSSASKPTAAPAPPPAPSPAPAPVAAPAATDAETFGSATLSCSSGAGISSAACRLSGVTSFSPSVSSTMGCSYEALNHSSTTAK